ncbi:MAG TPA: hypothetical protein VF815_34015 [Myxococcaceae bacterium]
MRRAVILTALPEECQAVLAHLENIEEVIHKEGTVYKRGLFTSPVGDWEVLLGMTGKYNSRAASATERAIQFWQPEVALFVGIAGGLKDVDIGDVVASDKVYDFEAGKANLEFEPRPEVGHSSSRLEERAKWITLGSDWLSRLRGPPPGASARAFVGPIATGSKVVAATESLRVRAACAVQRAF